MGRAGHRHGGRRDPGRPHPRRARAPFRRRRPARLPVCAGCRAARRHGGAGTQRGRAARRAAHRLPRLAADPRAGAGPKVLLEAFGIRRAFLTLVQAYSEQQHLADMPAAEPRRGRAAAENVVLQRTGAAQALGWLVPELRGKVTGLAMNVPVADGSAADLVCWHERPVTVEEVNRTLREAAAGRLAGILDYEDQPIVSSDALRRESSGTFDSLATMVLAGNVSKTLTWFDNGWGYAHRLLDLIRRFREIDARVAAGAKETGR
ncbi:MAG TPA: hypothetical protein VKY89_20580 [Thermoanaerobaculia bacterium]|nr:hypothetical protein [Thermoanaerobaculia bacterium]